MIQSKNFTGKLSAIGRPDSASLSQQGLDEDGNPVTVEAAQKMYHSNKNTVFFPK